MKKLLTLIFLTSLSSPAFAMPAIFGVTTNGSQTVPYGVKLSETDGVTSVELDPSNPGDVTIDPNPIDIMPTLPDDFVFPPVVGDPGPEGIPGAIGGGESPFTASEMLNAIPMPRGGR